MYKYKLNKDTDLVFLTRPDVFHPTATSDLLIGACEKTLSRPKKVLDLGCGCGIAGLTLAKLGLVKGPLFASDISMGAIELTKHNADKMGVKCIARCGSLFAPWAGETFDIIIDDVAGLSDDIAKISPWYPEGVQCNANKDGTKWIVQIIEQSKQYLNRNGALVFPVLTLSDMDKILNVLKRIYTSYELIARRDWFLPDEIAENELFLPLLKEKIISCEHKFGKWIWSTFIYKAYN